MKEIDDEMQDALKELAEAFPFAFDKYPGYEAGYEFIEQEATFMVRDWDNPTQKYKVARGMKCLHPVIKEEIILQKTQGKHRGRIEKIKIPYEWIKRYGAEFVTWWYDKKNFLHAKVYYKQEEEKKKIRYEDHMRPYEDEPLW